MCLKLKQSQRIFRQAACLLAIAIIAVMLLQRTKEDRLFYQVSRTPLAESDYFRAFDLGEYGLNEARRFAERYGQKTEEVLAVWLSTGSLPLNEEKAPLSLLNYLFHRSCLRLLHAESFSLLRESIGALISDEVLCFPVMADEQGGSPDWSFDNSWGGARTYGGDRTHEGIDIMGEGAAAVAGRAPIVSMTDGVIQSLGWLELGGWRIGIMAESGVYYYYAHLESYAQGLNVGDTVKAGQLIGFMGDSGYGTEGTTGQFAVHLHMGMYLMSGDEMYAVNPYWILRDLSDDFLTGAWRP